MTRKRVSNKKDGNEVKKMEKLSDNGGAAAEAVNTESGVEETEEIVEKVVGNSKNDSYEHRKINRITPRKVIQRFT